MRNDSHQDPKADFVVFDHVDKSYDGETLAVRDISFAVAKGEFFTMLGPSGSGKTSCLMMLAGFEEPTTGDIRLGGRSLARVPPYERNIGVVFQSYALFPNMTAAENVGFPLSVRKISRAVIERRVADALALVRLQDYATRKPSQLSGGQQQRVAVARSLVFNPDLVLMDEPLGALDRQLREHLQIELRKIQQEVGATVIYVTHDQTEALTMSDRVAVFSHGGLQQIGTPAEIYLNPASAFVAAFIGETNMLTGVVVAMTEDRCDVAVPDFGVVVARRADITKVGQAALVSVRPEHVSIDTPRTNTTVARVTRTVFYGDHTRIGLTVGGTELFVRAPATGRPVGETMAIGWNADDCIALAA